MAIDVDTISVLIGERLDLDQMTDALNEMSAEDLVQLSAQVAIAEALQEIAYHVRETMGAR